MQIKTTMRYHFTPTRMTKIEKIDNTKYRWGYVAMGILTQLAGVKSSATTLEYSLAVSTKN